MRAALRPDSPAAEKNRVVAYSVQAGLRVSVTPLDPYPYRQAPSREAADLRNRATSILWSVGDRIWDLVVAPTIVALEALPDPGRAITRYAVWELLTATR